MKKGWRLFLELFMLSILVFWVTLTLKIYNYNNESHVLYLTDDNFSNDLYRDENISVRLAPRGEGTSELTYWEAAYGKETEDGWEFVRNYGAVIYELEIINNSVDEITDWNCRIGFSEDVCLNGGWNGDFIVHQSGKFSVSDQCINAKEFKEEFVKLDSFHINDALLIPLRTGDYFDYIPTKSAQELPIVASEPNKNITYSKTIGFVLYIGDIEYGYKTKFQNSYVTYELSKSLVHMPEFYGIIILSLLWIILFTVATVAGIKDKKYIEKRKHDMTIIEQSMRVFIEFIEAKDPSTKGHSIRVAKYSRKIAEYLGMSPDECQNIYFIGMLHDCGKVTIPENILCKPSGLTEEEYSIMKSHAKRGSDMLRRFDAIPGIGDGALCHHERYDGNGYPNGLKGSEIPLVGRIICVADAFDAMTGIRCYQEPLPEDEVLKKLRDDRGKHFDPVIVDALLALIEKKEIVIPS